MTHYHMHRAAILHAHAALFASVGYWRSASCLLAMADWHERKARVERGSVAP